VLLFCLRPSPPIECRPVSRLRTDFLDYSKADDHFPRISQAVAAQPDCGSSHPVSDWEDAGRSILSLQHSIQRVGLGRAGQRSTQIEGHVSAVLSKAIASLELASSKLTLRS